MAGSKRIASLAVLWSLIGFLLFLFSGRAPSPLAYDAGQAVDYYLDDGQQVKLTILKDRIGLFTRKEVQADDLTRFVDDTAWKLESFAPGGISELSAGKDREPAELEKKVRTLTQRNTGLESARPIRHAGLLVLTEGSKTPMLLTEEFIVEFNDDVDADFIKQLNEKLKVKVVHQDPVRKNQFVLRSTAESKLSFLEAPLRYHETGRVKLAHPNFVQRKVLRQTIPNDSLFNDQWHHQNTGQGGGTADADIDAPLAWDISIGSVNRVIAVIDFGFEVTHPDLVPNLWTNLGENPLDMLDNDHNGHVNDINGWNFEDDSGDLSGDPHGTSVAGCVGARGNNTIGVSGTCPRCRLMFIKTGEYSTVAQDVKAINYARDMGAEIINISWGYKEGPVPSQVKSAINGAAMNGRGGLGCVIFCAMPDEKLNLCSGTNADLSSLASVIAVSGATDTDSLARHGFGDCMDVLGPTRNSVSGIGQKGISTTFPFPTGYIDFFNGTSAATPVVAGIAGLALEVAPTLIREQVQRLIQDTADKTEDTQGGYSPISGISTHASSAPTHGFGRVNAFEAVRVVAPPALNGRGGVDIMMRDNRLDWGNTEQPSSTTFEETRGFIPHWESFDIKVDAPPFQSAPTDSLQFDAFTDEDPQATRTNRVYVRVRNRGPFKADSVTVKLHWAFAGTALPALPGDFWSVFPADSTDTSHWHPLAPQTVANLEYCGSSVAGVMGADVARIIGFDFMAPALNPSVPAPEHYCLLCMADSPQDPISATARGSLIPDFITPRDNNVAQRNLVLKPSTGNLRSRIRFMARNPYDRPLKTRIEASAPPGWKTYLDQGALPLTLQLNPGEERLLLLNIIAPDSNSAARIVVTQYDADRNRSPPIGGLTVRVGPTTLR